MAKTVAALSWCTGILLLTSASRRGNFACSAFQLLCIFFQDLDVYLEHALLMDGDGLDTAQKRALFFGTALVRLGASFVGAAEVLFVETMKHVNPTKFIDFSEAAAMIAVVYFLICSTQSAASSALSTAEIHLGAMPGMAQEIVRSLVNTSRKVLSGTRTNAADVVNLIVHVYEITAIQKKSNEEMERYHRTLTIQGVIIEGLNAVSTRQTFTES